MQKGKLIKRGFALVHYGPWVPKPIEPPLAKPIAQAITTIADKKCLPRICSVVKNSMNAAIARDEILGI